MAGLMPLVEVDAAAGATDEEPYSTTGAVADVVVLAVATESVSGPN